MRTSSFDIVLSTLNAKYVHPAFGLRYLLANLGDLQPRARLLEFDLKTEPGRVADLILAERPLIAGLGVHIWNVAPMTAVAARLKEQNPDIELVLGGPEVSFEIEDQPIARLADYIITGEGDVCFAGLCRQLLEGRRPADRVIPAPPPDPAELALPYPLYSDEDLAHRLVYVESSRGCPFRCEYCVSAHDAPVRFFPLPLLFEAWQRLLDRGARVFKFVDRTFNLRIERCTAILDFFLERMRPGLFVHLEMMPDRFPPALRERLMRFPPGSLQLEIGVQTFDAEVAARIQRPLNPAAIEESFRFLRGETQAFLHADLIAGLPGETLESFAAGFDRLLRLNPQKIQVGILKRLRGAPITRHDAEWQMRYSARPPYEVLSTSTLDAGALERITHFARFWELIVNRGHFPETAPLLWRGTASPFHAFLAAGDWLYAHFRRAHGLPLTELADALFEFLTVVRGFDSEAVVDGLVRDYQGPGRRDLPSFTACLVRRHTGT